MRISDWSSDVCSSDLNEKGALAPLPLDQAVVLQAPQRLADRVTADAELLAKRMLSRQAVSRGEVLGQPANPDASHLQVFGKRIEEPVRQGETNLAGSL